MLYPKLYLIFGCAILVACGPSANHQRETIYREGESPVEIISTDDLEMEQARISAQQTFVQFDTALLSEKAYYYDFAIKVRYITSAGYEHIWIGNIKKEGDDYRGVVGNTPVNISGISLGDTVKIDIDEINEISDWTYVDAGALRGGYTYRVMRKRMTEEERKAFDADQNFVIID